MSSHPLPSPALSFSLSILRLSFSHSFTQQVGALVLHESFFAFLADLTFVKEN